MPNCPRCGYDQRGVITQWSDRCPLRGTCPECGLNFNWNEVLNPQINLPAWSIERSVGAWRFPLQIVGTCLRAHWPWNVWRQIRMSHRVNASRLIAFLAILVLSTWVWFGMSHGWLAYHQWNEQVSRMGGGVTASSGGLPVFAQAALLPWSNQPRGTFTTTGGGWSGTVTNTFPYTTPRYYVRQSWELIGPPILWAIAVQACCGLAFFALPVSRCNAKVQWRHIVRLTIYGMGLLVLPVALAIAAVVLHSARATGPNVMVLAVLTFGVLFIPSIVVWWSVGTSRYLHMPHGWAVGIAVVTIGVMLPLLPWGIAVMFDTLNE